MSVESRPNKLVKGLVLDTFHTDVDNTVATYALNAQLEDQEGNHFHYGSEVGTTYIKEIPTGHVVVGHINMERNETVLFTTDGTNSTIGILSRNDNMAYHYEIKVDDTKQTKKLNFKKEGYVRGVYRLLNGCDKVIYFVDGVNKDRRVNINQLDSYKIADTQSVASGIIFDDSLKATIFALSSASGNIQLIRLMSASPEATANVLATLSSGAELTKLLTASANGIGTALANLMRTANIISSVEATGTTTTNVDIVRLLQGNVTAIGSVNAILESIQQGVVEIDVTLSGVASSTAILLRTALLESSLTTEASTVVEAILTKVINAQSQATANTSSTAQITIPVNATANATAITAADALLSYAINATAIAIAETSATAQLSKVITASVDALASSSSEALIGLVLVSTTTANGSISSANLFINRLLTSSVTAEGTTTVEALIAKLLDSSVTAQSDTTTDLLISKLLESTVSGLGSVTANLQLADLLSTELSGTATTEAVLEAISSMFSINRGLRFSAARSTYLSRTPTVAGSRTTWTWSGWVKRSGLNALQALFSVQSSGEDTIGIVSDNTIRINFTTGNGTMVTNNVFRDISAWYNIVLAVDTTQVTSSNRVKLYVNNIQQSFVTGNYPNKDFLTLVNNTNIHYIGFYANQVLPNGIFDGYMAEINFIDGQALTPTSFGELNLNLGTWIPKAYTGTYGTNGFRLNFNDVSGITATTLGKDSSVNGNNWTPNNFSVTAGVNYDGMTDSPTNTSETIGNYATLNPLENTGLTITNGNINAFYSSASYPSAKSSISMSSGKWYWETTFNQSGLYLMTGIYNTNIALPPISASGYISFSQHGWSYENTGELRNNNVPIYSGITSSTTNDIIMIAVDIDNSKLWFGKNGTWFNSGNPANGTSASYSNLNGASMSPAVSVYNSATGLSLNFGQRPFAYTPPTGFKALNTFNLPTPTIGATTATQANKFMDVSLYTGTGAAQSVFNSGFKPDLVWIKNRTGTAANHAIYDINRGVTKQLSSSTTAAETTETTGLTSFNSNGFTIGALGQINTSGNNYIAWQWRASGTTVANNVGLIPSTVSVNTTSGFSVVTYTGNGLSTNQTVGHGLGIIPSFVIIKDRSVVNGWHIYHKTLGINQGLLFNTSASFSATGFFTGMSSSVIGLGYGAGGINTNSNNHIAYAWAEIDGFSKFNSYVGNGSTDGTFVYTGFRPKFILIKASSTTGNWAMYNSIVNTSNPVINELLANTSAIENTTGTDLDFLSNGFKLRSTNADINTSAATYIYAAFGEFPLKYANAALTERVRETVEVDYLVVAGGGGGGKSLANNYGSSGGGGAGGYRQLTNQTIQKGIGITVTVGDGGNGATIAGVAGANGNDSVFIITSSGGGGGGSSSNTSTKNGLNGGSGGGGGFNLGTGGLGNTPSTSPSQGNNGGANIGGGGAGGGGGSSTAGANDTTGVGGNGTTNTITTSSLIYAAGGGGGGYGILGSLGGNSGNGNAGNGGNGAVNPSTNGGNGIIYFGGGGGGGASGPNGISNGGNGGKGVVVIKWLTSLATITLSNGAETNAQSYTDGSFSIREIRNSGTITFN
jgi:hypothetical protein